MRTAVFTLGGVFVVLGGCLGTYSLTGPGAGPGGTGPGGVDGTDGGTIAYDYKADFEARVKTMLVGGDNKSGACGACHAVAAGVGPAFLEPKPDTLTNMLTYPGLIGATPETSRIVSKGLHEGPAFTADQLMVMSDWIVKYNLFKGSDPSVDGGVSKPIIAPFELMLGGTNTVDLSVLDPGLAGQSISFSPSLVGADTLKLADVTIKTAPAMGLRVVHPLFVLWDAQYNAIPDPVDSFSSLDQTVPGGSSQPMGPGLLILPGYKAGMKVNIAFTKVEPKMGVVSDGGAVGGCKSVALFTSNVRPTLSQRCVGCHGAGNARLAFPMDKVNDLSAAAQAEACAAVRGEVDVNTPNNSRIYTYTDPANQTHANRFKFAAADLQTFKDSANQWINAEK